MPGRSFRFARIAGIPVGISPWWLLIVALITWSLGASYFPEEVPGLAAPAAYALGLGSALLLFASILAHEFGHAIVARRHGIEVEEIDLWLLGGVAQMRGEATRPEDELRYALAGPAVSAVIAACFVALLAALPQSSPPVLTALVRYEAYVNGAILVFNLLPAFPLDGGRVLRSLLWRRSREKQRATRTAASVGRVFGYVMIALGLIAFLDNDATGLWLCLVGGFLVVASGAQARASELTGTFTGVRASALMSREAVSIPGDMPLEEAIERYLRPFHYHAFPVVDERGRAIGILRVDELEAHLSRHETAALRSTRVGRFADLDEALLIEEDADVGALLSTPAFARVGRAVVLDGKRHPVGLLSITDVEAALRFRTSDDGSRLGMRR